MPLHLLSSLLLQILLVGYTPGPANIFALSMALRYGRKRALGMWLGLLAGAATAVYLCAVILHFAGEAFGQYVVWLKYPGAAYLVYLAWKIWNAPKMEASGESKSCTFRDGFIVQVTNAKIILFELTALSTFVLPYSTSLVDLLLVATLLLVAGPGANLVWLLFGSLFSEKISKYQKVVNAICAVALLLCAVYIIL